MRDQRSSLRRDTIVYLPVIDPVFSAEYGRVVDLSLEGLLMISDRPPTIGVAIPAEVVIPETLAGLSAFRCTLTPRWHRRDRNPVYTLVGCRMEIEDAVGGIVAALMQKYGFPGEQVVVQP